MRPRVEEILEEVRAHLDAAGFEHLPSQQIVLTGGASQVPGMDTLASRILGQQVRLGRPLRIHRLPQAYSGPVVRHWSAFPCLQHTPKMNGGISKCLHKNWAHALFAKRFVGSKRIGNHKFLRTWPDRANFRCFSLYFA